MKKNILLLFLFCCNPKRFFVLLDKLYKKIFLIIAGNKKKSITKIIKKKSSLINFMKKKDKKIYLESQNFYKDLKKESVLKLKNINYDLGGGGASNLLYFLVRKYKPKIVLESGVGAGFSSNAILSGINKNKKGTLYSSDFPYFRIPNAEKYIGILVKKKLKKKWNLYIDGDRINLLKIKKKIRNKKIDLIHYDSDKSYFGKSFFFKSISEYIKTNSIIIIDDIQDDNFFFDYIEENKFKNFKIFKFKNKFLGLIYNI
jgi:predicted O-methyltransferase YrrM